jgi:hypothetical protein
MAFASIRVLFFKRIISLAFLSGFCLTVSSDDFKGSGLVREVATPFLGECDSVVALVMDIGKIMLGVDGRLGTPFFLGFPFFLAFF